MNLRLAAGLVSRGLVELLLKMQLPCLILRHLKLPLELSEGRVRGRRSGTPRLPP